MNLRELYSGENAPFEGDMTLWLRSLPEGAVATRAAITLQPVAPPGGSLFRETIRFSGSQGDLGATKTPETPGNEYVEVDFHARRTLLRAVGTGTNLSLQVDMGGAFIGVAADGTFLANGASPWTVNLTAAGDNLPALTVSRFRLTELVTGSGTLDLSQVDFRSVPSNLQIRLGQMAPFWVRLGDLTRSETTPDFSEVLNFFLADAEVENGFYQLPLVIHSDTLARLKITLGITYVIEQPVLPPHLSEANLAYDFSTLPGEAESLLKVKLPRGAVPVEGRTRAAIRGTFEPSRLALGEPGPTAAAGTVTVSAGCSLAQAVAAEKEIALSGIDLPLANTRSGLAGLNVSLVKDADGKPSGEVLTSAEVEVGKALPDGTVWGSATLAERFRILPGVRHWLVLQSRSGEAWWSVAAGKAGDPALQCSRDGGLSWRAAGGTALKPPLAALFRLRHVPDRFTLPVQLQIGSGPGAVRRRLDEFAPAERIEFSFDFAGKLGEHMRQPENAPLCQGDSPLRNADFALPRPRDATRRLFGFDSASSWQVTSAIDLSRGINLSQERYVVLSVDGSSPRRIDCAGADPARTSPEEIVAAINRGAGAEIAGLTGGMYTSATSSLRLVSPHGNAGTITLHPWCGTGLPECWEGTADRMHRIKRNRLNEAVEGFALLLADGSLVARGFAPADVEGPTLRLACFSGHSPPASAEPGAVLRQGFAASSRCGYVMNLVHRILAAVKVEGRDACSPEALPPPSWEMEWFDAAGASLRVDGANLEVVVAEKSKIRTSSPEIRLTPPENVAQAELRILHPASARYGVLIEGLGLTATVEAARNGGFSRWEEVAGQNVPADWSVASGWTERGYGGGVLLRGDGPEDAVLVQEAAVTAETEYLIRVRALPSAPVAETDNLSPAARARLELNWLQGRTPVGEAVLLPLDGAGFPAKGWRGSAPAGADGAELRLVQPQGTGQLAVEEVLFEKLDLVQVPLTFLGESPGQLKVGDLRVAWDLPAVQTASRSTAVRAMALKQARTAAEPAMLVTPATSVELAMSVMPAMSIVPAVAPLADQPTIVISGIGKYFSEALARRGIRTVGQLAACEIQDIEGISPARLMEMRASAELALDCALRMSCSAALADRPVREVLGGSPAELARLGGQPLEEIRQLQKILRAQYHLLDNEALERMTLKDLASGRPNESNESPE
jgi:predicted flap endonuclease-1-like 5' DNA nuclease